VVTAHFLVRIIIFGLLLDIIGLLEAIKPAGLRPSSRVVTFLLQKTKTTKWQAARCTRRRYLEWMLYSQLSVCRPHTARLPASLHRPTTKSWYFPVFLGN